MSGVNDKKGFSGLKSLVSDIDDIVTESPHRPTQPEKRVGDVQGKDKPRSGPSDLASSPRFSPLSNVLWGKWTEWFRLGLALLGGAFASIGAIALLIALIYFVVDDNEDDLGKSELQISDLKFSKPPAREGKVLTLPQIRWCLREDVRIETLRLMLATNLQSLQFNKIVEDYNKRCGNFRYKPSTMTQAQREIERVRPQIVANVTPPWQSSAIPNREVSKQRSQLTLDVQNALAKLGYDPGPFDGLYGVRTKAAIQCFQREIGVADDGQVTQALLERLRHMPDSPHKLIRAYHENYQDQLEGENFDTFKKRIDKSEDEKLVEDMATYMYKDKYSDYKRDDYDSKTGLTEWRRRRASRRQCG